MERVKGRRCGVWTGGMLMREGDQSTFTYTCSSALSSCHLCCLCRLRRGHRSVFPRTLPLISLRYSLFLFLLFLFSYFIFSSLRSLVGVQSDRQHAAGDWRAAGPHICLCIMCIVREAPQGRAGQKLRPQPPARRRSPGAGPVSSVFLL